MQRPSVIVLVDCDSFYASCERVFCPDLARRPVIVLLNTDGIIGATSKNAKTLGLVLGVPIFHIEEMVMQENVAVFSSNYMFYGDLSRMVMGTLSAILFDDERPASIGRDCYDKNDGWH